MDTAQDVVGSLDVGVSVTGALEVPLTATPEMGVDGDGEALASTGTQVHAYEEDLLKLRDDAKFLLQCCVRACDAFLFHVGGYYAAAGSKRVLGKDRISKERWEAWYSHGCRRTFMTAKTGLYLTKLRDEATKDIIQHMTQYLQETCSSTDTITAAATTSRIYDCITLYHWFCPKHASRFNKSFRQSTQWNQ
eukprot:m.47149 g.47149  ORF g.47149 m.47149 type:complete len:192 (-) comp10959_c1_seq4:2896-3471(-)